MTVIRPLFVASVVLLCVSAAGAQEALPEAAARVGQPFTRPRLRELSPALTVEELARAADLVVHGVVKPIRTRLSSDRQAIYTDFEITPKSVIAARNATGVRSSPGKVAVVFTQYGGTMTFSGVQVDCIDYNLPLFESGAELVVFLRKPRDGEVHQLVGGVGAFAVKDGKIRPLMQPALKLDSVNGSTVAEFAASISHARVSQK